MAACANFTLGPANVAQLSNYSSYCTNVMEQYGQIRLEVVVELFLKCNAEVSYYSSYHN